MTLFASMFVTFTKVWKLEAKDVMGMRSWKTVRLGYAVVWSSTKFGLLFLTIGSQFPRNYVLQHNQDLCANPNVKQFSDIKSLVLVIGVTVILSFSCLVANEVAR